MKYIRVSNQIWALKIWVGFQIRVWVVMEKDGITLVDAGISTMAKGILRFIEQLQAGPLLRIVLTHGHPDHVGAIQPLLKKTSIPVYAHPIEIAYMEGERPYPRRRKAKAVLPRGIAQSLALDDTGRMQRIGDLTPYHTPGHAPGHTVFHHEQDQALIAGDLFTSKKGKLHRPMPMFTSDMAEAVRSSSIVQEIQPIHLEVSHGNAVLNPADQLEEYRRSMRLTSLVN